MAMTKIGYLVVNKTKYRESEWGISYSSTDVGTAYSEEDALAIAKYVVDKVDTCNILEMREAAQEYIKANSLH